MNAQEIIDLVKGSNPEAGLKCWVAILEDGEALAALGLTDEDQDEVEDAHSELSADLGVYYRFAGEFGKVGFDGVEYALIEQASQTNRVFSGWFGDVSTGEEYTDEWCANAIREDGETAVVYWQFDVTKGSEPEAEDLDWDDVHHVA